VSANASNKSDSDFFILPLPPPQEEGVLEEEVVVEEEEVEGVVLWQGGRIWMQGAACVCVYCGWVSGWVSKREREGEPKPQTRCVCVCV